MTGIAKKAAQGLGWLAVIQYTNRITGFVTTLILAKLVVPEDFGLIVIATMVLELVNIMKDMGVSQALIYRREEMVRAASTAFFLIVGLNLVFFSGVIAIAPSMADFFDAESVPVVLMVMASNLIWFGLRSVPEALIRKELDFRKLLVPTIVPVAVASILSICMALMGYGVWSLVARSLVVEILSTLLIWRYTTFRPKLLFDTKVARELLGYGKYIIGASIMGVLLYNVDKFYLGKYSTLEALGIYSLAYTIAHVPVGELGHLVCRVMFPALSKVNDDIETFRSALLSTLRLSSIVSIPLGIGIAVYGPEMVRLFFDPKWWDMIIPLQILAVAATFRATSVLLHEACKAAGKPQAVQYAMAYRLVIVSGLGLFAVIHGGVSALAAVIALTYASALIWEILLVRYWLRISSADCLRAISYPTLISILVICGVFWSSSFVLEAGALTHLIVGVLLSVMIYVAITVRWSPDLIKTVRLALRSQSSVS